MKKLIIFLALAAALMPLREASADPTLPSPTTKAYVGNLDGTLKWPASFLARTASTAAAPSFTFYGDSNTGIYRISPGTLGFASAGVEAMRLDAGQLVLPPNSSIGFGGTGAASTLTNLGGTTIGKSLFKLTNPSAVRFLRINADNTISARTAAEMATDLSLAIGTNVQAYDGDLTTYAGITPSANVQTLLGAADFAAMRTSLGLVIGTNVQAYDADLTTYAGITPSANVQTLLGSGSFAAFRTSLGVGTGDSPQFSAINVGHASDTTLTRSAAGVLAVEGVDLMKTDATVFNTISISAGTGGLNIGVSNTTTAAAGIALGTGNSVNGTGAITLGGSNGADSNYAISVGYLNGASGGDYAIALGSSNSSSASYALSVGFSNQVSGSASGAFGHYVENSANGVEELGIWDDGTRLGGVRVHSTGMVALTVQDTATPYTDGGTTAGAEADNTLPRNSYALRSSGGYLYLDSNDDFGTIRTTALSQPHSEATIDFTSMAGGEVRTEIIYLTDAVAGDYVTLSLPDSPPNGIVFDAYVYNSGEVTIRATNVSGGTIDPASATYGAKISHP